MKRKGIVVSEEVFDLKLDDIRATIANKDGKLPVMELEVGATVFLMGLAGAHKGFALNWWAGTNIMNVVWTRFVLLEPTWPPVKSLDFFVVEKG